MPSPSLAAYAVRKRALTRAHDNMDVLGSAESPEVVELKHSHDLWYDDGSVVIIAQDTGFLVHRTILASHSSRFRELFRKLQSNEDPELSGDSPVPGVPSLRVDDAASDMEHLLHALYRRDYLESMVPHIPFAVLSSLMRSGHKYAITGIVDEAASHLEDYYTTDFKTWVEHCRGERETTYDHSETEEFAELIELVNLSRLTGKFNMLPLALYRCAQYSSEDLVYGYHRADGPIEYFSVSPYDSSRCLDGRDWLMQQSCRLTGTIGGATPAMSCKKIGGCAPWLLALYEEYVRALPELMAPDALASLEERLGPLKTCPGWTQLCDECRRLLVKRHEAAIWETWQQLPAALHLDGDEDDEDAVGAEWYQPLST
ncbi:hypothetical protein C8Q77DRAFT_644075 [Trametes polyzona]|nr:hypothetical protein C8Q77DRAFT_644075 [Trametes polyzona]